MLLSGVVPYMFWLLAGDIGEGSNDFGISVLSVETGLGFIISIANVRGDSCAALRRRRPTRSIAVPMTTSERTYAPMIAPIWAGRYLGSRSADAAMGGPSPGGGAGACQMLTCQILVAEAVMLKFVQIIDRHTKRWKDIMVVALHVYRMAAGQVDNDRHAESDACFF